MKQRTCLTRQESESILTSPTLIVPTTLRCAWHHSQLLNSEETTDERWMCLLHIVTAPLHGALGCAEGRHLAWHVKEQRSCKQAFG